MYPRTATRLLVVVVAAGFLLASSCAVTAHRPPRPLPPVMLGGGGGDAGTRGSFGRIRTPGRPPRGGGTWELGARRLGQQGSLDNPPSPKHGMAKEVWAPDPPPPPSSVKE